MLGARGGSEQVLVARWRLSACIASFALALAEAGFAQSTPAGLKVAFTGDQGLGEDPESVLRLVLDEGAEALFVQGDFDYADDPEAWDAMLTGVLGPNFPVIALVGNHDEARWEGAGGYQARLTQRMQRIGLGWTGELGVQATLRYKGLFVVQTAPNVFDDGYDHAAFIRTSLAGDASIWSISAWHKLMAAMNVGGKGDETGWGVYEESRRGGAIIATAHEHSYSRTHLLSSMERQTIASTGEPLVLSEDDPATPADEGRSFAFVSGLGGNSIRDQERSGDWWAAVYTSTQGAADGALFATFHVNGDPRLAHFYFKDVLGNVADDFLVRSSVGGAGTSPTPTATATATATPTPLPSPGATPTATPSALPSGAPSPCADGLDNDRDGKIDHPADRGCDSPADLYEQKGKSWKLLLRDMARQRGVSKKQLRREIRGTPEEQRLFDLGMPQR